MIVLKKFIADIKKKEIPKNLSPHGTTVAFDRGARFRSYAGNVHETADMNEIRKHCPDDWTENLRRQQDHHIKYGAERVKECILRHETNLVDIDITLDKEDQLIMQPTSIGGGMNVDRMSYLISCFKPHKIDVEDNDN